MTKPKFLHKLPIEQLKQMSQQHIKQTIKAEQLYFRHRPKKMYYLAVNGAKSKNGGLVMVGSYLESGDEIVDSPNNSVAINIFIGDKAPEGFLYQEGVNHG
ncbi:hypothetical protein [Acinetobacter guillouiae]|uniref:hypothetical protein n=1 Tax=Acinetobacter guillouiae TaxID=106649 RepID=UPI00125057A2|nr:hypothetical protein [Acinetobacter guillouiae]